MRGLTRALVLVACAAPLAPAAPVAPMPRAVAPAPAKLYQPAPEASAPELVGAKSAPWLIELKARNVPKGTALVWDVTPEDRAQVRVVKTEQALLVAGPPGEYRVKCRLVRIVGGEPDVTELRETVTLTGGAAPPGPTPPGPKPPDPPTPAPVGFRVIFVYETSAPLTPAMQQVMFGEKVRTYLDAKTVAGAAGKGYRRFDKDVDATNERDKDIQALWGATKPQLPNPFVPCVVVAVGGKAEILPFPATEDAALELFRKYAGDK